MAGLRRFARNDGASLQKQRAQAGAPRFVLTWKPRGALARDFHALIQGFAAGQSIDLADDAYHFTPGAGASEGYLLIESGSSSANLHFLGSYQTSNFHVATDTHGGTLLTVG